MVVAPRCKLQREGQSVGITPLARSALKETHCRQSMNRASRTACMLKRVFRILKKVLINDFFFFFWKRTVINFLLKSLKMEYQNVFLLKMSIPLYSVQFLKEYVSNDFVFNFDM